MRSQIYYLIMVLVIIFLAAFVAYYAWRLATARRQAEEGDQRLQAFARRQMRPGAPGDVIDPAATTAPPPVSVGGEGRVYEKQLGLAALSESPIFIRRSKAGEVDVQMGERPPMPLKYVLDPAARRVLNEVSLQAVVDLGPSWSIVAMDDDQGRLTIKRLS